MQKSYDAVLSSPLGKLGVKIQQKKIANIDFLPATTDTQSPISSLAKEVERQLNFYFENPNFIFNLPLNPEGTFFQLSVWELLRTIPKGSTLTYGSVAQKLKTSSRAVGGACRRNPIPIIIPCHRIIAIEGLGGYAGETGGEIIKFKEWLLRHEGVNL